jgi:hypothetical protein
VIDILKAAFVHGMLAKDEFDLRVGQAFASRTRIELSALTADLPARLTAAQPPGPGRAPGEARALRFGTVIADCSCSSPGRASVPAPAKEPNEPGSPPCRHDPAPAGKRPTFHSCP